MTEGLNQTIKKFLCYLFNPSSPELRSFGLSPIPLRNTGEKVKYFLSYRQAHNKRMPQNSPLPCPAALRGATKQYREEGVLQSSSPVFCNVKYRGRCPKDGGVKKQRQQQNQVPILSPCVPTRNIGGVPEGRGG